MWFFDPKYKVWKTHFRRRFDDDGVLQGGTPKDVGVIFVPLGFLFTIFIENLAPIFFGLLVAVIGIISDYALFFLWKKGIIKLED